MGVWEVADALLFIYVLVVVFLRHSTLGRRRNLLTEVLLEIGVVAFVLLTALEKLVG